MWEVCRIINRTWNRWELARAINVIMFLSILPILLFVDFVVGKCSSETSTLSLRNATFALIRWCLFLPGLFN